MVGLAAYLALMVTVVVWVWRTCAGEPVRPVRRMAAGWLRWRLVVLGLVAHLTVHNLVDNLFVQGMVVYVGLWLALVQIEL